MERIVASPKKNPSHGKWRIGKRTVVLAHKTIVFINGVFVGWQHVHYKPNKLLWLLLTAQVLAVKKRLKLFTKIHPFLTFTLRINIGIMFLVFRREQKHFFSLCIPFLRLQFLVCMFIFHFDNSIECLRDSNTI